MRLQTSFPVLLLQYFDSIFNVKHGRALRMIFVPFIRLSKLFFRGKKSPYKLFVWMQFVFRFLVSFLQFSSIRESKYNKVGILFINTTDFFFPCWMLSHSYISLVLRSERGLKILRNDCCINTCHFPATCMCQAVMNNLGCVGKR